MASAFVALVALTSRLLLLPLIPPPKPSVHDEFSYLLAAQTFALGRLTNPTPPMWIHFETFQELMHPSYASKYPPGMGLMLACGQLIFHEPWVAVLISMAVLCGLITWALCGWLPLRWAIAGGLIAVMHLTGSYWTESYWGGTLAAIGGALVIGALGRLMRRTALAPAFAYGFGLAILANTRPYEGLVLGLLCTGFLIVRAASQVRRGRENASQLVYRVGIPIASVLLPTLIWMGYYNFRVTGNPLLMPYDLYETQYTQWSAFLWSNTPRPEPTYNHQVLRTFWVGWDGNAKQFRRHHILQVHWENLQDLYHFYLSFPLLLCLLIAGSRLLRNRRLRIPLALLAIFYLGVAVEVNLFPHYVAPATVLVYLLVAAAVRDISSQFASGRARAIAITAIFCCIALFEVPRLVNPAARFCNSFDKSDFIMKRDMVISQLQKEGAQLLVFVRYGPMHNVHDEWVFNDADIDQSSIVWARAMPDGKNEELLRYFPGRLVWLLDDDGRTVTLRPVKGNKLGGALTISTQPVR
ncbi:MAG TPA: hypothetical protein VMU16_05700 [Candidatus Binataceae bacterium]|nr:hypothetical protein [Candidatus Binataceae bacterium]